MTDNNNNNGKSIVLLLLLVLVGYLMGVSHQLLTQLILSFVE